MNLILIWRKDQVIICSFDFQIYEFRVSSFPLDGARKSNHSSMLQVNLKQAHRSISVDVNNLISGICSLQQSFKLGFGSLLGSQSHQHQDVQLSQSTLLVGWPHSWLGHDCLIYEQWCPLLGALQPRYKAFENGDNITIAPVVRTLADEEGGRVPLRLWLEEAVLHEGYASLKRADECLPLGEHVG